MTIEIDPNTWTAVSAIATALSAVAVAGSALVIVLQLRRMRLAQEVGVALSLHDRSTSAEVMAAASWVKAEMPIDFPYADFKRDAAARKKLETLWYYFEFVGVLVNRGYVSDVLFFDQQGAFISGIWDKTRHLVYARRKDRASPQYMENFELLRNRFVDWAKRNKPKLAPESRRKAEYYYDGERTAAHTADQSTSSA